MPRLGAVAPTWTAGPGFRDFVEYNVEAEALGFHSTFVVEHHFTGFGQISATLNLLTWIGARTSTLRLGTAVMTLPWHNPVLLAEQAATIDLLSNGRLDFGIGQGYRHNEFAGFCVPMEEAEARFEESLEVMLKAWTADAPWSHHGKYWQFDNVVVEPPTAQKPHPPLWMGAGRPASIKKVAAYGYNLLLDQFAPIPQIGERIALFKAEVEARGRVFDPMSVAVTRSINVVDRGRASGPRRWRRGWPRAGGWIAWPSVPTARTRRASCPTPTRSRPPRPARSTARPTRSPTKLQALRDVGAEYVLLNSAGGPSQPAPLRSRGAARVRRVALIRPERPCAASTSTPT